MDLCLTIRVAVLRLLFWLNDLMERRQAPRPPQCSFIETIPSPTKTGSVSLHFYTSASFRDKDSSEHPVVFVFHGGGFTAGRPRMDARWIGTLLAIDSHPVVVSVDYGLAPETSYPGSIQDAVAAISWLVDHGAHKLGLDTQRIVLTGFSAGGTLALASSMWSHSTSSIKSFDFLRGIVCIYPGLDFRTARAPAKSMLARFMTGTWDDAFYCRSPVDSPFVSPAAAKDSLLHRALPERIALYSVSKDDLMESCEEFRERLLQLGKRVTGDVELDAIHAWDKYPIKMGDAARWTKREDWFKRMAWDVKEMLAK